MPTRRAMLLAMALATAVTLLWQQDQRRSAAGWLRWARQAPLRLSYDAGLEVTISGGDHPLVSAVRLSHRAPDRSWYRYDGPALTGVELRLAGDRAARFDPQTGWQSLRTMTPLAIPDELRGYRVTVTRSEAVAGRPTVRVRLTRQGSRREVWLDRQTGLVLRFRQSQGGSLLSETRFVSLEPAPSAEPLPPLPGSATAAVSGPLSVAELSRQVGFPVVPPAWLPGGFRLAGNRRCDCHCGCCDGAAQLVYSDGVGQISVFYTSQGCERCYASEAACFACQQEGRALQLANSAVQVVGYSDGQLLVVAMGDASPTELARVVASVPGARARP